MSSGTSFNQSNGDRSSVTDLNNVTEEQFDKFLLTGLSPRRVPGAIPKLSCLSLSTGPPHLHKV